LRFWFKNKKLEALYTEEKGAHKYPPGVVDAFLDVMSVIAAALDERDLYKLKGLRYEKLKGDRKGQHSIHLNDQFRLIVEREKDNQGRYLLIIGIEDYH
jgi:proteic killer suppression protein